MPENVSEQPGMKDLSFGQRLESLVRENETFREAFVNGVDQHIASLRRSLQSGDDEEQPDAHEAIGAFTKLREIINSGFDGYELRAYKGTKKDPSVLLCLAKPEDLDPEDSGRLDISGGKRKNEIEIVLARLIDAGSFNRDPAKVYAGRGVHMEIRTKSVWFNGALDRVSMQAHNGFSINMTVGGECTGKATKYDGIIPYDSRKVYKIHTVTNPLFDEIAAMQI